MKTALGGVWAGEGKTLSGQFISIAVISYCSLKKAGGHSKCACHVLVASLTKIYMLSDFSEQVGDIQTEAFYRRMYRVSY